MKVKVDGKALGEAATLIRGVLGPKPTLPILGCILLEAEGGDRLRLAATDLERHLVLTVPATVQQAGRAAPDGQRFVAIARELAADGELTLTAEKERVQIKGRGRFTVPALPSEDVPEPPKLQPVGTLRVKGADLLTGVRRTEFAASEDPSRWALNAVRLTATAEGLKFEATDGHRLVVTSVRVEALEGQWDRDLLVPTAAAETMRAVVKPADEVVIAADANAMEVRTATAHLGVRLIEGQYPNVDAVLDGPRKYTATTTIATRDLLQALRRAVLVANERTHPVKLTFRSDRSDGLAVEATSSDGGQAELSVECAWPHAELTIGFNGRYLLDWLQLVTSETVQVGLGTALQPLRLVEPSEGRPYECLVMPMRL